MEKEQKVATGWNLDNSYARLPKETYSKLFPTPVKAPKLILCNLALAQELGLNHEWLMSQEGVQVLSGNMIPEGSEPLAQAYAGHQFGHFTMLGDGRAILLGEQITKDGKRFDIQWKGSGRTPFSRGQDGRAALGPMLREYIISEAMYGLGIPTTRSLAVVATGEMVYRDTALPGAVLTRVAASHVRVGTFQYAAASEQAELLRELVDFTLKRHYPGGEEASNKALYLLQEVVKSQASLIAKWQLVGFIHGVMNTDNMALSGESIDFGPCAFMDVYDEDTVFSSIDREGRYAYGTQPKMAAWNLARFAETLLPLIDEEPSIAVEFAQREVTRFHELYQGEWLAGMRAKLGMHNQETGDEELIQELLTMMKQHRADYTNTFRLLTLGQIGDIKMFQSKEFEAWYQQWQARVHRQAETSVSWQQLMKNSNPSIIPRNHRVEEALTAAVEQDNLEKLKRLIKVLAKPYAYTKDQEEYINLPEIQQKYQTFCGT